MRQSSVREPSTIGLDHGGIVKFIDEILVVDPAIGTAETRSRAIRECAGATT